MEQSISHWIDTIRSTDESEELEAKTLNDLTKPESFLRTISAFANYKGGKVLIGVGPKPTFDIIGVSDFDKVLTDVSSLCNTAFNIQILFSEKHEIVEGKNVVLLSISKSMSNIVYIKNKGLDNGVYIRQGSSNIKCDHQTILSLMKQTNTIDYETEPLDDCSIDDIDDETIDMYKLLRSNVEPRATELRMGKFDFLKALNCTTNGRLNRLGVLCFGTESAYERYFTSSVIDYVVLDSNQWVDDPNFRFEKNWKIRKSIILQRIEFQDLLERNIRKIFSHTDNIESQEISVIPMNALDEAVTNALMHRDYSVNSTIQVVQYGNRIEFRNPGYSLKSLETMKESGSCQRNPKLCLIFERIRFCESIGTGIKTMIESMKRYNLEEPIIDSNKDQNHYMITFLYKHLLDEVTQDHLKPFVARHNLLDIEIAALAYVYKIGHINNEIFRQINRVDIYTASESLKKLVKKGLLVNNGVSKRDSDYVPTALFLDGK